VRAAWNYEAKTTTFVIDIALQYHFFRTLPRFWNGSFDPTSLRREASLFNLAGAFQVPAILFWLHPLPGIVGTELFPANAEIQFASSR
jgi:hypothetical protein